MQRVSSSASLLILVLAICGISFSSSAQQELTSPQAFFSDYGNSFTPHHELIAYFKQVGEQSPRVVVQQYGSTYEGRPLIVAFVSSEENITNLEALRVNHLKRSGMLEGQPSGSEKAVVWLSYSVHGNEAAGSEASPQVLFDLASAKTGDSLATYLENTIVIIDPSLNPDGYTRYTDDQRRRATTFLQPNPSAWEHQEGWPNGRTNHYMFDLNRDWAWLSQKESQARVKVYLDWLPHVHADLHEMGPESSYYFAPAAEPYHNYITPFQRDFQFAIGRNHARIFDQKGWLYYTREEFDLLYPSYGDTYPTYSGAIGMTYEQSGTGEAGRAMLRPEGDTITLAARKAHHHATSLSTIAVASRNAKQLIKEMAAYRKAAAQERRGNFEAYVFAANSNSANRLSSLIRLLDAHHIQYGTAKSDGNASGKGFEATSLTNFSIRKGDLVVPSRQLQGVLAQILLDPITVVADSNTYDITAWSLPTILGLDGFASKSEVKFEEGFTATSPTVTANPPGYGFVIPMDGLPAWMAVAPMLHEGMVARFSPKESTNNGVKIPAGSLMVLARDHAPSAYAKTYAALRESGLALQPLQGGFATTGYDIGSDNIAKIKAPTVVLIQDDAVDPNAFGHVWHFFEQRLHFPIRPVPWSKISAKALADVDVVILSNAYLDLSGNSFTELKDWINAGGRLIAMENSADQLRLKDGFALSEKEEKVGLRTVNAGADPMRPYADRRRSRISNFIPGALVETQVDYTHPLAFGLSKSFFTLRTDNRPWAFLEDGYNVIGIRSDPEVRGFVGSQVRAQLEETLTLGVQPMGNGDIVYAADNLAYRGFWENGMQVLANAVFYR